MLQQPIVRSASAATHVVFIALVLSFAWQTLQLRMGIFDETGGTSNRIVAALGVSLAAAMVIGLILWLSKGQIELLLIPDSILLVTFGLLLSFHIEAVFVVCFLALAAALVPVLTDPRRQQRAAPPVYWPGYGPGVPPNPPAGSSTPERPKTPPTN